MGATSLLRLRRTVSIVFALLFLAALAGAYMLSTAFLPMIVFLGVGGVTRVYVVIDRKLTRRLQLMAMDSRLASNE